MTNNDIIDMTHIPNHIAIIMDGNGRWAKLKGQARSFGHQAGADLRHHHHGAGHERRHRV